MERSTLFYMLLGAGTVLIPAMTDRLLNGRVADGLRIALDFLAAALTGAIFVLIARSLGS